MKRFFATSALASLLSFSACGTAHEPQVSPEFSAIYASFQTDAARFHRDLDVGDLVIQFGPLLEPNTLASCEPPKTVVVVKEYWVQLTDSGKELLLYHELGHCVLQQAHRPQSIMAPTPLFGDQFAQSREDFVSELFTHTSVPSDDAFGSCKLK